MKNAITNLQKMMRSPLRKPCGPNAAVLFACAFCGLVFSAPDAARADRGRGSIRAAATAPREAARREPASEEPARAPQNDHREAPPPVAQERREARPEPAHAVQPPRNDVRGRDWDDNDEDARHFGGFAPGAAVRATRGERIHALPPRNFHLHFGKVDYFLDDTGAYYQPQPDGEYVVVQPPVGISVTTVPSGATPVVVGPATYYYLDGVFYVAQDGAFAVVNPPPGIVVPALPVGAAQVVINGNVVYQFNGFNYQPSLQGGITVYTVTPA